MSHDWNVLVPEEIDPSGPESITDFATYTGMDEYESVTDALDDIARYDAVIMRVAPIDEEVINRADRLQVISKHGAGLDSVDIDAASNHNIVVCNTPGANSRSVAEHAMSLLFAIRRNLRAADKDVRSGSWNRAKFQGHELTGDTLGLYGFGDISREVAELAHGMGQNVLTYDPYVSDTEIPARVARITELSDLFARSDAVSIHTPLTDETHHAVSDEELSALGENGVLINTARGEVVDETALHSALKTGRLFGAGLDTFEQEPPGNNNPLYERDDVILTPHVGGVTDAALRRMSNRSARNVRTVYKGDIPNSTVNRAALEEDT